MSEIIKENKVNVTMRFECWGRTYEAKLHKVKSKKAVEVLKDHTEFRTLPELMVPIYNDYEKHFDMGDNGVYKPTDLINHYRIKEV